MLNNNYQILKKKSYFFNILNELEGKKSNIKEYSHLQPLGWFLKNRKNFKTYWNFDLFLYDYYFYLKKNFNNYEINKKNLTIKFFKDFNSLNLVTLTRFYCHIGSQKTKLNNFWRGFIFGSYFNINIINLNYSLIIFKLILNIFSKFFFKFFETSKILIFSTVKKNTIFKLGGMFGRNYYISKWVFGLFTNKTLWWKKRKKFKKKKPRILMRPGGFPILGFFTNFELNSQREFILSEFNKFSIPTFTISDVSLHKSYETHTCPLNSKNHYSICFYLLTLAKLILKNKFLKNSLWLWSLNNFLIKIFLVKKKKIKIKKRRKRRRRHTRRKPFYSWNQSRLIRDHYKAVESLKDSYMYILGIDE